WPYSAALISLSVPSTPTRSTRTNTPRPFDMSLTFGAGSSVRWTVFGILGLTAIAFMMIPLVSWRTLRVLIALRCGRELITLDEVHRGRSSRPLQLSLPSDLQVVPRVPDEKSWNPQ